MNKDEIKILVGLINSITSKVSCMIETIEGATPCTSCE